MVTEAEILANQGSMGAGGDPDDYDTITLNGVIIPVTGMNYTDLGVFETKITFGDFTKDSDNVMSTSVRSTFTGGALISDQQEGTTDARFDFATLHTRSPSQLALNGQDFTVVLVDSEDPEHLVYPIGDFKNKYYTIIHRTLWQMDSPAGLANAPVDCGDVPSAPRERGTVWKGLLHIPLGSGGYATVTNVGVMTVHAPAAAPNDITPVSFTVWDNKLFALNDNGELRRDVGAGWVASAASATLPVDDIPRRLHWFYDRGGEPMVAIITDKGIWGYEADTNVIHQSRFSLPPHPDNGLASSEWRDDAIYYAAGLGVYKYTSTGTISPVGLDRDDGLPAQYNGRIIDLISEHNGLIALVEGVQSNPAPALLDLDVDAGPFGSSTFGGSFPTSLNLVMMFNEAGWHCLWAGEESSRMTWLAMSAVESPDVTSGVTKLNYGFHFGITNDVSEPEDHFFPLPKYFFGPKKLVQQKNYPFREYGEMLDGEFDASMRGFPKLASHIEVNIKNPRDGLSPEGRVEVWYQIDESSSWTQLGTASAYGRNILPFNVDVSGFSLGQSFYSIRFWYKFFRGATMTRTPVVDSIVFKFLKLPLPGTSWACNVPLGYSDDFLGNSNTSYREFLRLLPVSGIFTKMQVKRNGKAYRVRVARAQGGQPVGNRTDGTVQLSIILVDIAGWDDNA
jgi:hypothetical protein